MNKKFSTLLTAGLLVAGSLFSSAFADKIQDYMGDAATKIENGTKYILVQGDQRNLALGFTEYNLDTKKVTLAVTPIANDEVTESSVKAYIWTVSESEVALSNPKKYITTFTNVLTGQVLRVMNDGSAVVTEYSAANVNASSSSWAWAGWNTYAKALEAANTNLYAAQAVSDGQTNQILRINTDAANDDYVTIQPTTGGKATYNFKLYKVSDSEVSDTDLNKLYNTAGFNLKLTDKTLDASVDNLLKDETLMAIKVAGVNTDDANFGFPAGTYFVTETPGYPYDGTLDYLLNCTFIAVSPSDNVATNASRQNNGEGFVLTTVKGKDLNLMKAGLSATTLAGIDDNKKPCGSTINVNNAAFTVKKNITNSKEVFAVSLANMFYSKNGAKVTDVQSCKPARLNVLSDASYSSSRAVVSDPTSGSAFIFEFVESNVAEGTDFISADGKSIYNIQISSDLYLASLMNKEGTTSDYSFFATGSAMADLDIPAYQFVVTNVKGNEVTFTNRASQDAFTVKLFEQGNDYYTLAESNGTKYEILDIKNNGDVEKRSHFDWGTSTYVTPYDLNLSWVKLIPAEAEEISGLDVADGTQVTIAFARDYTPTSNKMYPVLDNANKLSTMTDDVEEAVQWQLNKYPVAQYKTLTYAYLDTDNKVAYKSKGDTITYYLYALEMVEDGNATGNYLTPGASVGSIYTVDNGRYFFITDNWDGSSMITTDGKTIVSVSQYDVDPAADIEDELNRKAQSKSILATSKANNIKTYLVQDAPEVSLPASAKYVTLQSELGNHITMNEEGDAIVVSNEPLTFRVFATDLNNVVPSFFISTGYEDGARSFLFNPEDSVNYYVGAGQYDKDYQWKEGIKKAIFKAGVLNETADTLTTAIKGDVVEVANKANNQGVKGGLNRFKYQIVLAPGEDDLYLIRQLKANDLEMAAATPAGSVDAANYLAVWNGRVVWGDKDAAEKFAIAETTSPTSNEAVAAAEVSVIAQNGAIIVKGAAGKVVTVANILGQTIANQVAASDNVTIAAPAGVAVVTVDGQATKVIVK